MSGRRKWPPAAGVALSVSLGRDARDRLAEAADPGLVGALAALETFYCAFNQRDAALLGRVWADAPLVQLNNPLGGVLRGGADIAALYGRIFHGPARVWVEFHDVVAYHAGAVVVFAGRERGEFAHGGEVIPLAIRTSRVFACLPGENGARWAQVHHHGSIDDPERLAGYQGAVAGRPQPSF